jgi:hypothetical protein
MKTLLTHAGCRIIDHGDGRVSFTADADIDCDGGSNPLKDPHWQPTTSLTYHGKPIDAETVPFFVLPLPVIRALKPVVLGCQARVTNTRTGQSCMAVVADVGPTSKIGEISVAAAKLIGVDPHPITGGEHERIILYEFWPGQPANLQGRSYALKALRPSRPKPAPAVTTGKLL